MAWKLLTLAIGMIGTVGAQEAPAVAPLRLDFQALPLGPLPETMTVTDQEAKFQISADGENKVLELLPQPIIDGGVLLGESIKGGAVIAARVKGTGKKRSHPRLGVGLFGVSGPRLLLVPARKELHLVIAKESEDTPVATAPLTWESGAWTHVELRITPAPEGAAIEGRVWVDGTARPAEPTLRYTSKIAPGQGKGSVWGAPFSELAILFDDVVIASAP
jgi:hypothetical protein